MKFSLFGLVNMIAVALAFTACSDDDEVVASSSTLASNVTGTYSGYTTSSCDYFSDWVCIDESITVSSASETTVDVSYDSGKWGTFAIEDAIVSECDSSYAISGSGTAEIVIGTDTCTYTVSVDAVIDSDGEVTSWTFNAPSSPWGDLAIDFIEGDATASSIVAATYRGYTQAATPHFSNLITPDETVTVSVSTETTVDISYVSGTWGTFTIEDAAVTVNGNSYYIDGSGTAEMDTEMVSGSYEVNVEAIINSDKNIELWKFELPSVMQSLIINFIEGDAPDTGD